MTDYEFVKERYDKNGSCVKVDPGRCSRCPIPGGLCLPEAVYEKAKAWLENYEKENIMDGIKVTVEEKKAEKKSEYPCLKINPTGGLVVFFTARDAGYVCAVGESHWPIGEFVDCFDERGFEPFHGKITIEVE